ncbi:hypothetical protein FB567DRAFT_499190 [Paraphoma chrysanthemicola]|uniref:Uncharacterized protein n=1 Tax=Paraphoma chrysanthemicola TaxID=798071 RepID=A0A8K0R0V9_9PLEO|nr:hypothetical protein FB567DRAFT_499190 [Paraphoma chrysanthemicola]
MASKSSSPGPNPTATTPAKQTRSRKAATQVSNVGRAGSAGGIVLEKEKEAKSKSTPTASKATAPTPTTQDDTVSTPSKTPRRKPRKLNKEPTSTTSTATTPAQPSTIPKTDATPPTATELEALKSRVRGLEAKVEELYKNGTLDRPGRSPRRRGKGRKNSSQQQVPTLGSSGGKKTVAENEGDDDVEEIGRGNGNIDGDVNMDADGDEEVEELVRLEGELEVARQDLAAYRPRASRRASGRTNKDAAEEDDDEDIEEIDRNTNNNNAKGPSRHVTLSGSYRIPLPSSVSVDDVKHIQSGVSAAQNVARSFLEQRRAAASKQPTPPSARPTPRSVKSSLEIAEVGGPEGKQSWSEWIGGYSVAISRAVRSIEHEAAVESQSNSGTGAGGGGKRPGVKTKLSGEQAEGLMR